MSPEISELDKPWKTTDVVFWLVFVSVFVGTLFVPVFPLYKGYIRIYLAPVLLVYLALFGMPEYFSIAFPIAATHFALSYFLAKAASNLSDSYKRSTFSIRTLMIAMGALSIWVGMTVRFKEVGFVVGFLGLAISLATANLTQTKSVGGISVPAIHRNVSIGLLILCGLVFYAKHSG